MAPKRKRNAVATTTSEETVSSNTGRNEAAAAVNSAEIDSSSAFTTQFGPQPHPAQPSDAVDDIQKEISRRRAQLEKEEHDLKVSLCKARIERAVLAQTRTIIDARIRDLQAQVKR
jgi:hypothetical protein